MSRKEPFERLQDAREKAGYETVRDATTAFGWTYSTYAAHENGTRKLTPEVARRYAAAFRTTAAWLLYGNEKDNVEPEPVSVPVIGRVAAGVWLDADTFEYHDETWVPAVRSPEFRSGKQVAYRVEGPSMNKVIPDGSYAIGVLFGEARHPRHRDVVILRRERAGLVETTIKRYVVDGEQILLMPESDDPRYQTPIDLAAPEDGTHVEIHALVVGSYRPL